MVKTMTNLRKDLANVEAKLDRLNHYREYLIRRLSDFEGGVDPLGREKALDSKPADDYGCRNFVAIRVADGYLGAVARSNPNLIVLDKSRKDLDFLEFDCYWKDVKADAHNKVWLTLSAWWRLANLKKDESLRAEVIRTLKGSGVSDSDERVAVFQQLAETLPLEGFGEDSSRNGTRC